MAGERIFIVEDERLVAEDLKLMLERLGYQVTGLAADGESALKKMEEVSPQLVLMDIRIQGAIDGIDVAEQVVARFDIPVIYLTAYADDTTVERAKGTMPSGYILKPFDERSLKTTIDLALYRHKVDRMIKNVEEWHGGILENLSAAVLAIDPKGNVAYMNKAAEALTGKVFDQVFSKPIEDIFAFKNRTPGSVQSPLFIENGGSRRAIDCKESPVSDADGEVLGTALLLVESNPQVGHRE